MGLVGAVYHSSGGDCDVTFYSGIKVKRRTEEQDFHKSVAQYLTLAMPLDAVWTTFPAGGGGKVRGAHLKAMGLRPGVADVLWWWRGGFGAIELKARKGVLSESQKRFLLDFCGAGGCYLTAKSLPEIDLHLANTCQLPLRTRIGA
jgi:hypothetical protein